MEGWGWGGLGWQVRHEPSVGKVAPGMKGKWRWKQHWERRPNSSWEKCSEKAEGLESTRIWCVTSSYVTVDKSLCLWSINGYINMNITDITFIRIQWAGNWWLSPNLSPSVSFLHLLSKFKASLGKKVINKETCKGIKVISDFPWTWLVSSLKISLSFSSFISNQLKQIK